MTNIMIYSNSFVAENKEAYQEIIIGRVQEYFMNRL